MKRILSILLAALMVVSIFVMPTSAAGSGKTTSTGYTYDFEDVDIRNYVDGQVFDLGWKEAEKAPSVDGSIDTGEYTLSGTFIRNLNDAVTEGTPDEILVYMAVKNGYLYVAFEPGDVERQTIQFDVGIGNTHLGEGAYNRTRIISKPDGTFGGNAPLIWEAGTGTGCSGYAALDGATFIPETAYDYGTYEFKFDLAQFYRIFSSFTNGKGTYDTPCVTFAFWYMGAEHYAIDIANGKNAGSGRNIDWVPYTIIIPYESLALINAEKNVMGELGADWRNLVEGQLVVLKDYATTLPTVDGVITSDSEYQVYKDYKSTDAGASGNPDFRIYYSVGTNGLIYVGLKYKEDVVGRVITQYGLSGNTGYGMYSRHGVTINADGTINKKQGNFWYAPTKLEAYGTADYFATGDGAQYCSITSHALKHNDTTTETVLEYSVSISQMIAAYEDVGNCADLCNTFVQELLLSGVGGRYAVSQPTTAQKTKMMGLTGLAYTINWNLPTLQLPDDVVERFRITDIDSLQGYGQKHITAGPSTATPDGVIGASEYTGSYTFNAGDVTDGFNYFAADDKYVYIGSKVIHSQYKSGSSGYQWDIEIPDNDGKVDSGMSYTRVSGSLHVLEDGTVKIGNPGITFRAQYDYNNPGSKDPSTGLNYTNATQDAWLARLKQVTDGFTMAASRDADTGVTVYEIKISKEALNYVWGLDTDLTDGVTPAIDQVMFFNYIYGPGESFAYVNLGSGHHAAVTLNRLTRADNEGACPYTAGWFAQGVVKFTNDKATKLGASVRLSSSASGLRFKTTYSNEYLAKMAAIAAAEGKTMEVGTLIAPKDYVDAAGAFTHEALAAKYGTKGYVEVLAVQASPFENVNGVTTFAGSLVNIKAGNLDREFAGIGYIKIGDWVFYSNEYAVKSVSDVATAAIGDVNKAKTDVYKYEVSAGVYSPYSEGQRTILNNLIAK